MANEVEYIDLTPTWLGILPAMLDVIRNGTTFEARADIEREFVRMARIADKYVALVKAGEVPGHPANVGPIEA